MKREREERYGTKCGKREDTPTVRRLESEKKDIVKRTKSKEFTVGWVGFFIQIPRHAENHIVVLQIFQKLFGQCEIFLNLFIYLR